MRTLVGTPDPPDRRFLAEHLIEQALDAEVQLVGFGLLLAGSDELKQSKVFEVAELFAVQQADLIDWLLR